MVRPSLFAYDPVPTRMSWPTARKGYLAPRTTFVVSRTVEEEGRVGNYEHRRRRERRKENALGMSIIFAATPKYGTAKDGISTPLKRRGREANLCKSPSSLVAPEGQPQSRQRTRSR
jgi:hypothetical protein